MMVTMHKMCWDETAVTEYEKFLIELKNEVEMVINHIKQ